MLAATFYDHEIIVALKLIAYAQINLMHIWYVFFFCESTSLRESNSCERRIGQQESRPLRKQFGKMPLNAIAHVEVFLISMLFDVWVFALWKILSPFLS